MRGEVRRLTAARPLVPFRIFTVEGRVYDVGSPDEIALGDSHLVLRGRGDDGTGSPAVRIAWGDIASVRTPNGTIRPRPEDWPRWPDRPARAVRRRLQFRLSTLLLLFALVAIALGVWATREKIRQYQWNNVVTEFWGGPEARHALAQPHRATVCRLAPVKARTYSIDPGNYRVVEGPAVLAPATTGRLGQAIRTSKDYLGAWYQMPSHAEMRLQLEGKGKVVRLDVSITGQWIVRHADQPRYYEVMAISPRLAAEFQSVYGEAFPPTASEPPGSP